MHIKIKIKKFLKGFTVIVVCNITGYYIKYQIDRAGRIMRENSEENEI